MTTSNDFDTIEGIIEAIKQLDDAFRRAHTMSEFMKTIMDRERINVRSFEYRDACMSYIEAVEIKIQTKDAVKTLNKRLLEICANSP